MDKYKLTTESIIYEGRTLFRIQAVRSFNDILVGAHGGWVESTTNLSQEGGSWVYGDAQVYGDALVFGSAKVYGSARVSGDARVYGSAKVYGYARVYGSARVFGSARVYSSAKVYGYARVYGSAEVYGYARVHGSAKVHGSAEVYSSAEVYGSAEVFGISSVSTKLTNTVTNIIGLPYNITLTNYHMRIGCECHTFARWRTFTEKEIEMMDGASASSFWDSYGEVLLSLADRRDNHG